ncbi:MAG TPA: hypothetical protein DDZ88_23400 [Verrucomicrobiales bacterium]|nr:hypothetical protein [Verrucomicrobiales bacterium]
MACGADGRAGAGFGDPADDGEGAEGLLEAASTGATGGAGAAGFFRLHQRKTATPARTRRTGQNFRAMVTA